MNKDEWMRKSMLIGLIGYVVAFIGGYMAMNDKAGDQELQMTMVVLFGTIGTIGFIIAGLIALSGDGSLGRGSGGFWRLLALLGGLASIITIITALKSC